MRRLFIILSILLFSTLAHAQRVTVGGFTNPYYTVTCVSQYSLIETNDLVGCTVFNQNKPYGKIKQAFLYLSYVRVMLESDEVRNLLTLDNRNPGECPFGQRADGSCKSNCEFLTDKNVSRDLTWDAYIYGNDVKWGCYGEQPPNLCKMTLVNKSSGNPSACNGSNNDIEVGTQCSGTFRHAPQGCSVKGFGGGTPPSPDDGNGDNPDGDGDGDNSNGDGNGNDSDGDGVPDYEYPKGKVPTHTTVTLGDLGAMNKGGFGAINDTNWHGFKRIADSLQSVVLDDRKRQTEFNQLFTTTMNELRNVLMNNNPNPTDPTQPIDFSAVTQKLGENHTGMVKELWEISSEDWFIVDHKIEADKKMTKEMIAQMEKTTTAFEGAIVNANTGLVEVIKQGSTAFDERFSGQTTAIKGAMETQTAALKESMSHQTSAFEQNFNNVVNAIEKLNNSGGDGSGGGSDGDGDGDCTGDDCPPDGNDGQYTEPQAGDKFGANWLVSEETIGNTKAEIEELKTDLDAQLGKFKDLFSLDTSQFNNGQFVEHKLDLVINGKAQSFKSSVFIGLRDNADFISKIIFFICVLIGLKIIFKWSD